MSTRRPILIAWLCLPGALAHADIDSVYEPAPPANAGYVRFINPGSTPMTVRLSSMETLRVEAGQFSRYGVVTDTRASLDISTPGRTTHVELPPIAGGYFTYALIPAQRAPLALQDDASAFNLLKSRLGFYNLSNLCRKADLLAETPRMLEVLVGIARHEQAQRTVNPVPARFRARCHPTAGAPILTDDAELATLQSGQRYSFALIDSAQGPRLIATRDTTSPYRR